MTREEIDRIGTELDAQRGEVKRLNEQRYFRVEGSLLRVAGWNLVRGLAFGLGSTLGAKILLAFFVQMLSSIDFVPILGDWAQRIIQEIQMNGSP